MNSRLLVAEMVSVRFGGLVAVNQVSVEIPENALVGIVGPNGAGKTTFFNALSGVAPLSEGRLIVDGRNVTGHQPHEFAWAGVARTFQTPRVFTGMTVGDNVRFGIEFAGRRRCGTGRMPPDADELLEFVGLGDMADQPAGAITPARQRLLEIAMALGAAPRLLLLDEVAAGLTEAEVENMAGLIRRCRDVWGVSVLWIEHAVGVLFRAVERVIVLHQGALLADGPPSEVVRDREVIEAYLGDAAAGMT